MGCRKARQPILKVLLLSFLESSADGLGAGSSTAGAYCDLICGAVGVAIVVHAVLYVAANAFDVLLAAALLGSIVLVHFYILLCGDKLIIYPKTKFMRIARRKESLWQFLLFRICILIR